MKQKLKDNGITLIALVVTIVVLLILAGVTVNMVLSNNGILNMAQKAAEETKKASEEEQRQIARFNAMMNRETYKYTAKDGKTVSIPAGFAPTQIDGEDSVNDGLVIVDSEGNEFVWVPCENGEYKKHTYKNENTNDKVTVVRDKSETGDADAGWSTWDYRVYSDWKDDEIDEEENKKSVEKNKGFYIARYEAGVPSNADFYVDGSMSDKSYKNEDSKNITQTITGQNLKPVSKAKNQCWNFISQPNAKKVSERMYSGEAYGVRSQLVDGTAWDTAVTWISKDSNYNGIEKDSTAYGNCLNSTGKNQITEENCLFAEHLIKYEGGISKGWCLGKNYQYGKFTSGGTDSYKVPEGEETNYNGYESDTKYTYKHYVEMATGVSDKTKLKNIYDMAGNMLEWSTEYTYSGNTKHAANHGGSFGHDGGIYPVSFCNGSDPADKSSSPVYGFRVVLYVK